MPGEDRAGLCCRREPAHQKLRATAKAALTCLDRNRGTDLGESVEGGQS
jgi:hypothetical protein